jgi:hypothetical protein
MLSLVGVGLDGMAPAGGCGPGEDARDGLLEVPAGLAFDLMMEATEAVESVIARPVRGMLMPGRRRASRFTPSLTVATNPGEVNLLACHESGAPMPGRFADR